MGLFPGASVAFVSRTGKTTDVTQIKGWREKFTPSEAPSVPDKPQGKSVCLLVDMFLASKHQFISSSVLHI